MSDNITSINPEAINVALELTKMIIEKNDKNSADGYQKLATNPESFILNTFERCLNVANGGHARTAYSSQDD